LDLTITWVEMSGFIGLLAQLGRTVCCLHQQVNSDFRGSAFDALFAGAKTRVN
jgi:hypothetical protein